MAKFAVGEMALIILCPMRRDLDNTTCQILGLPSETGYHSKVPGPEGQTWVPPGQYDLLYCDGTSGSLLEERLRKLPPDDDQPAIRATTEEPGLTRLKKLLEQDTVPHKQTKREKA